jgi:hypothetical protein
MIQDMKKIRGYTMGSLAQHFLGTVFEGTDIMAPDEPMKKRGIFDTIKVNLINGEEYREKNIAFTMGGHHYVTSDPSYKLIPEDEVWIDGDMAKEDVIATMLHEITERALMKYMGIDYSLDKGEGAHEVANKVENIVRSFLDKIGKSAA